MSPTKTTSVFKLINTKHGVRTAKLITRAGAVTTPTFMPDGTRGAVKGLTPQQVESTGVQIVLANTYHLHLSPGEQVVKSLGGLHRFCHRPGPILTDSGGFQVFSLAHVSKITDDGVSFRDPATGNKILLTPEKSIQIQFDLGSDLMVAFDDVTAQDEQGRKRTREAFGRTHRWLERSVTEFQRLSKKLPASQRPLLFGVIQGGLDKKLRAKSLELVQATDVDGIAIGGLAVGETRKEMYEILDYLAPLYDPKRPHFLLGVGEPRDMRYAIERGIDMFDCVLPTRNARHGTAFVRSGCTASSCRTPKASAPMKLTTQHGVKSSGAPSTYRAYASVRSSAFPSAESVCGTCGKPFDDKIQLTNAKFVTDKKVIDPGCDCYACREGFSRGFLRHQFKVGEPLAGSLVSNHNIRYLERLCEEYRTLK